MMNRRSWIGVAAVCLAALPLTALGQPDSQPITTTICELQAHPEEFAGNFVRVRATLTLNSENAVLTDASCPHSDLYIWFGWDFHDSLPTALIESLDALKNPDTIHWQSAAPVIFRATKESERLSRLGQRQRRKRGYVKYLATFTGRFDYIPHWLAIKTVKGQVEAVSAYGHQNCCKARLEPESISEVSLARK